MPTGKLSRLKVVVALTLGIATTFTLHGYSYGRSNQSVYLLDGLRRANPALLGRDWFTTQTLQYHWAFSMLSAALIRLGAIQPAFLLAYLLLIALFHLAWFRMVRHLGGDLGAYLIAVTLSALAAGDTGLGMYQFFQDGSLLPSNVSNVMLLAGMAAWVERRVLLAGICFGVAGVFHLNHALVGSLVWLTVLAREAFPLSLVLGGEGRGEGLFARTRRVRPFASTAQSAPHPNPLPRVRGRGGMILALASMMALLPSAINVLIAARAKLSRSGALPLREFVDLYVRLRHPHHYQPSSWPVAIWLCFVLLAAVAWLRLRGPLRIIVIVCCGLMTIALLGAGIFWISETLVQLSLFRFSIYVELLGCSAAGVWLMRYPAARRASLVGLAATIAICVWRGPYWGAFKLPKDDAQYIQLCQWVRHNTPTDALLIVPPDEESMRLVGQRAIVVNFKGVPQLSAELIEWRQRLCDVLDLPNLQTVPRGYTQTFAWMRQRYDALDADELRAAAKKYDANFVVTLHEVPMLESSRVETGLASHYHLYAME